MNKYYLIIIGILLIIICLTFTNHKEVKHINIDSLNTNIKDRNIKIDSLNKELNILKYNDTLLSKDTIKIKEDIKDIDIKIKKTKHDKTSDTITINDFNELQRFFSQIILKKDSITLLAFNKEQLKIIIRDLKDNEYNKELISELETKITLLDSLNNTYLKIIINKDNQIKIQELIISNLNQNISDINAINKEQINTFKNKIKKKNKLITKLIITNVISLTIIILIL